MYNNGIPNINEKKPITKSGVLRKAQCLVNSFCHSIQYAPSPAATNIPIIGEATPRVVSIMPVDSMWLVIYLAVLYGYFVSACGFCQVFFVHDFFFRYFLFLFVVVRFWVAFMVLFTFYVQ